MWIGLTGFWRPYFFIALLALVEARLAKPAAGFKLCSSRHEADEIADMQIKQRRQVAV